MKIHMMVAAIALSGALGVSAMEEGERGIPVRTINDEFRGLVISPSSDIGRIKEMLKTHKDEIDITWDSTVFGFLLLPRVLSREVLELLLDAGSDPNQQSCYGETLLHRAVEKHDYEKTSFLVSRGVELDLQKKRNFTGRAPLHLAAHLGNKEIMQLLVGAGARKDIVDGEGKCPYDYRVQVDDRSINLFSFPSPETKLLEIPWSEHIKIHVEDYLEQKQSHLKSD